MKCGSIAEGLVGQRQTERQDVPLSFQRERKQTASAERSEQAARSLSKRLRWCVVHFRWGLITII